MFEQVKFMIDQRAIELTHAVGMTEEIRPGVGEVVTRAIRYVVRDLDLFHLVPVDGMGTEVARDG